MDFTQLNVRIAGSNQGGSIPEYARFLEHCLAPDRTSASTTVIASDGTYAYVSDDLGVTWTSYAHGLGRIVKSFTLTNGNRLLRIAGDEHTYLVDPTFKVIAQQHTSPNDWHGTWSIDQGQDDVLLYAEYTVSTPEVTVWRSDNAGLCWAPVLKIPTFNLATVHTRHLHSCIHNHQEPGTWYVSSGDQPDQCHFWCSLDNGLRWTELPPVYEGDLSINPKRLLRYTAAAMWQGKLYWVTDDTLGIGRAAFVEASVGKDNVRCRIVSLLGRNECRSLISCGGGTFVAMTEAKVKDAPGEVFLLTTDGACRLVLQIDNKLDNVSALSRSVASRYPRDGHFFSFDDGGIMGAGNSFVYYRLEENTVEHSLAELSGPNGINRRMQLKSATILSVPEPKCIPSRICSLCGKKQLTTNEQIAEAQKKRANGYTVDVKCAFCGSSTRQRVLRDLYDFTATSLTKNSHPRTAPLKCLIVSAGKWERDIVASFNYTITHVSLFDNFDDPNNRTGINIADMPEIETGAYNLFHAVGVFDYIPEIEKVFGEVSRILADRGHMVFFVQPFRLIDRTGESITKHLNALRHERTFAALDPNAISGVPDCRHGIGSLIDHAAEVGITLNLYRIYDTMSGTHMFFFVGAKQPQTPAC